MPPRSIKGHSTGLAGRMEYEPQAAVGQVSDPVPLPGQDRNPVLRLTLRPAFRANEAVASSYSGPVYFFLDGNLYWPAKAAIIIIHSYFHPRPNFANLALGW